MKIELNEIINFIRINFKDITEYQIQKYIDKKNRDYLFYKDIKSDNQFATIVKHKAKRLNYYFKLFLLLQGYFKNRINIDDLISYVENEKSDKKIYSYIRKKIIKKGGDYQYNVMEKIITKKIKKHILDKGFKLKNYLDIGCGSGKKTYYVGKYLKLNQNNIYCADIKQWFSLESKRSKYIKNFGEIKNDKIPYQSNKFSMISAFMVLHHVKNLNKLLKEIHRILKPGGYLYIHEHDAMTDFDRMLIDIQHSIFELVYRNNQNYINEYYGKYFDRFQWHYIMEKNNFKLVHYNFITKKIRVEITPTRYFYAIYKKI